jgi:alpha-tubulin suppressor-like RCC1 family protein
MLEKQLTDLRGEFLMTSVSNTPSLSAPWSRHTERVRQLTRVLSAALLATALGCGDEATSPTAPKAGPELATTSTQMLSFRQVNLGRAHTCGVTTDNLAYCWGNNRFGQLGDGTTTDHITPGPVARGLSFRQVDGADTHTCGVTDGDLAYCWGKKLDGRNLRPVPLDRTLRFRQVTAGGNSSLTVTCGVTTDDQAYCAGRNDQGQLGDGTTTDRSDLVPVAGGLRFRQVSAGASHACGVTTDDRAYCWGNASLLGNGSNQENSSVPVAVAGELRFRQVSAGITHTCGVTTDNRAYCWGFNHFGAIGDGTKDNDVLAPAAVAGGLSFRQVSAGYLFSCGATTGNVAYCWGHNDQGQLGDGTLRDRLTPAAVSGGLPFRQLGAGVLHSCGVTTGNVAYCWGHNGFGQLGDGTTSRRLRPRRVAG